MSGNNELHILNPSASRKNTYPLSTFTYAIVPQVAGKRDLLAQFIRYAATTGQIFRSALDFSPIPKVVQNAAKHSIGSLRAG